MPITLLSVAIGNPDTLGAALPRLHRWRCRETRSQSNDQRLQSSGTLNPNPKRKSMDPKVIAIVVESNRASVFQ